jgi:hypothetical protein
MEKTKFEWMNKLEPNVLMGLSHRQEVENYITELKFQYESLQLKEEREFEIDFDGNLKALIRITGNEIKVLKAVNGYGNPIDINLITSNPK